MSTQEIDLEKEAWEMIKRAAQRSNWIPEDYTMNDWVQDVCRFLRLGPVPSRAGFDPMAWSTVTLRPSFAWRLRCLTQPEIKIYFGQDLYYIEGFTGTKVVLGGVPENVRAKIEELSAAREALLEGMANGEKDPRSS